MINFYLIATILGLYFFSRQWPSNKYIRATLVRWYLSYPLSYQNIEELAASRGFSIKLNSVSIKRWASWFMPFLYSSTQAATWQVKDPTAGEWTIKKFYTLIQWRWVYLYVLVDQEGKAIDFMITNNLDQSAVSNFFQNSVNTDGIPT